MSNKQIKCYCGHTTYCDCGPLEEPKQETLEEAAERLIYRTIGGNYGLTSFDEHDQVDGIFDTYEEALASLKKLIEKQNEQQ